MAGYPKIWTTLRHEPWFRKLKAVQKCIWYEVIMMSKDQKDDGWVSARNLTTLAADIGCDRGSLRDWMGRESGADRVSHVNESKILLRFYLVDYNDSQQLKGYKPKRNAPQAEQSIQAEHTTRLELKADRPASPDLADKRIPDGTHGDKCDAIIKACKSYLNLGCSHVQAGQINKKAESVGQAIVAAYRVSKWVTTKKGFMGAVIRDLSESRGSTGKDDKRFPGWPDGDWERVKVENEQFERTLDQKYGNKMGDVIARMKEGRG